MTARKRMTIAILLIIGVGGLLTAALLEGGDEPADVTVRSEPAVNRLIPPRGDRVLQQSGVGIYLDARYRLTSLTIYFNDRFTDGVEVTSEVKHEQGINFWQFTPGQDKLIKALSPDDNCATAVYALISQPDDRNSISWCFKVA